MQNNVKKEWKLYECMPKVLNLVPLSSGTTSAIRTTLIISAAYWEASENYGPYENAPTPDPVSQVQDMGTRDEQGDTEGGGVDFRVAGYKSQGRATTHEKAPFKPGTKGLKSFDSGNKE
jgi:hypothetical protein